MDVCRGYAALRHKPDSPAPIALPAVPPEQASDAPGTARSSSPSRTGSRAPCRSRPCRRGMCRRQGTDSNPRRKSGTSRRRRSRNRWDRWGPSARRNRDAWAGRLVAESWSVPRHVVLGGCLPGAWATRMGMRRGVRLSCDAQTATIAAMAGESYDGVHRVASPPHNVTSRIDAWPHGWASTPRAVELHPGGISAAYGGSLPQATPYKGRLPHIVPVPSA